MALTATHNAQHGFSISRIGHAVLSFLVKLGEANALARDIEKLNKISDAEFEAKGTTRADAVQSLFVGRYFM